LSNDNNDHACVRYFYEHMFEMFLTYLLTVLDRAHAAMPSTDPSVRMRLSVNFKSVNRIH